MKGLPAALFAPDAYLSWNIAAMGGGCALFGKAIMNCVHAILMGIEADFLPPLAQTEGTDPQSRPANSESLGLANQEERLLGEVREPDVEPL